MKYLKLFEAFNDEIISDNTLNESVSNDYYHSISYDEFRDADSGGIEYFTNKELEEIKKCVNSKKLGFDVDSSRGGPWQVFIESKPYYSATNITNIVYKNSDEWFIVAMNTNLSPEYFKCDQLEGLLKLIEEKI